MKSQVALAVVLLIGGSPEASAHRYCMHITDNGKWGATYPDLNSTLPEFALVQTWTTSAGERISNIVFDGGSTPICTLPECERYRNQPGFKDVPANDGGTIAYSCMLR